ncbi:MAG TPA: hypothetical protein VGY55_25345 [Pirellulales bacterium]|jgi:uncharacterized repeat protein (TIGR01451 family)|nr:hypothetical protein [Pirellulales bacterium]
MKLRRFQIVIALLCLAGCQAPQSHGPIPTGAGDAMAVGAPLPVGPKFAAGAPKSQLQPQQPGLPTTAFTGYPGDGYTQPGNVPEFMQQAGDCTPLPTATFGPWRPPGIGGTWPPDEYICDGGGSPQTVVRSDWRIEGLKPEETIAHFDTIDGRTVVEPTNKVCLYAPRFAAVRKVDTPFDGHQLEEASGIAIREGLHQANEANLARSAMQPLEPIGAIEDKQSIALVKQQPGIDLSNRIGAGAVQDRVRPYEDFLYIRSGVMQDEEKPVLAQRIQAAITWTSDRGVQVTLSGRRATPVIGDQRASAVYEVDVPNHPRLQICKIASTDNAQPGETVDFTIRFDNVGDQKMGNVTIVDNLTTRLEYVPDSEQSSAKTTFSTQPNEVGSLVLRWEITDPLAPGQGGVIRFQCKVR